MHRHNASSTTFVLTSCLFVGTVLTSSGCRNAFPESHVNLQSRPANNPEGIEEPPSRLYSAFGLGRSKTGTQQRELSPEANQQQSTDPRFAAQASTNKTSNNQTSRVQQASAESSGARFSLSDSKTAPPAAATEDAPLTREEQQMLIEAFEGASPEIRRLAERRMSSLKAQAAKAPTEDEPQDALQRLPTLDGAQQASSAGASENLQAIAQVNAVSAKPNPEDFAMPDLSPSTPATPEKATASATGTPSTDATPSANSAPTSPASTSVTSTSTASASEQTNAESASSANVQLASNSQASNSASPTTTTPASEPTSVTTASTSTQTKPVASDAIPTIEETLATVSDKVLLDELIRREEQRMSEVMASGESALEEVVRLRAYRLFAGGLERATQPIDGWSLAEQEYINYQTLALWHLIDPASHPLRERRWAAALPELRQATNHLAAATGSLLVHNLSFCTAVDGFGQVTPFASDRFTAGQQVILYSEVENFVAERLSDGYETHLRGTYRILDATGRRVAEQVLAEDQQTCKNYRRDYFLPYILHLPDRLSAGNYRFELTLEDVKGKKYGTASIPFEIVAAAP